MRRSKYSRKIKETDAINDRVPAFRALRMIICRHFLRSAIPLQLVISVVTCWVMVAPLKPSLYENKIECGWG